MGFAIFRASRDDYEDSYLRTGRFIGGAAKKPSTLRAVFTSVPLHRTNSNTVQLGGMMVGVGGLVGRGQSRWRARLTCHLGFLRLMTRGLARRRRTGLSRCTIRAMA